MKIIKFDLPLNGTKVHNLEELRDNFTTEILEHHASGLLLKWLKNRNLMTEADKLSAIAANHNPADNLVALCDIFGIDADRKVIEAALSKGQPSQGVALREDPEELKYKEKFEKLSELMEGLKRKKLYITQDYYNRFVKDKIQIENEGNVEQVDFCDKIYEPDCSEWYSEFKVVVKQTCGEIRFNPIKQVGDVVEAGDIIGSIVATKYHHPLYDNALIGNIKSPLRGVLVKMGELPINCPIYREGDSICFIRIDHDTAPTIKIIPE